MDKGLVPTYWECPSCRQMRVVWHYGRGEIVSGPYCIKCQRSMRRLEVRQLELFPTKLYESTVNR